MPARRTLPVLSTALRTLRRSRASASVGSRTSLRRVAATSGSTRNASTTASDATAAASAAAASAAASSASTTSSAAGTASEASTPWASKPKPAPRTAADWRRLLESATDEWGVPLACLAVTGVTWYWLEASRRRTERVCDAVVGQTRAELRKLEEDVSGLAEKWVRDVVSREQSVLRVHEDNAELAKSVDSMTALLRQCDHK